MSIDIENKEVNVTTKKRAARKPAETVRKQSPGGTVKKKLPPMIEVMIIICDNEKGENVIKMLNFLNVSLQVLSMGEGTADSKTKEILGFGEGAKDIISCLIKVKDRAMIFNSLKNTLFIKEKQIGIAFTIPVDSALSSVLDRIGFVFLEEAKKL